ncbi:PhzF family phenazine biosynthesis protein [Alteromonas sp. ASW11-36]|uniref:PhzF family phenazine biosynthesis protein n=1 Tax=Alteromonas arenosi TaxID=3055817 RepID=A0ABT7SSK7_9ALTE|nr:PhzF family phenazine biosynthesis protein [Alteromonas sp. ASW11-36]MDM7859183.1 PhzF family phenazine biosynthesis protein [Alteromonas sp. ASW11-36]
MQLNLFQVDAFTHRLFGGNPAAVCPLSEWLSDDLLQAIAEENNLSETAFFVAKAQSFDLRWFTPEAEVDLCGHATLAAAHVIFKHLNYQQPSVEFDTKSGRLTVSREDDGYSLDFPACGSQLITEPSEISAVCKALGLAKRPIYTGADYLIPLESESAVRALRPDFQAMQSLGNRGVIVTAPGENVDFVSRCFYPKLRVNEDPVTGSAHCQLTPYWADRLGKTELMARQLSARGGEVQCGYDSPRVILVGSAVDYLSGTITLPR